MISVKGFGVLFLALIVLTVFAGEIRSETLTPEELSALFEEANGLFLEANEYANKNPWKAQDLYKKAALHFERLVDEGGVKNGKLFYNLGNAYFNIGDIGRAILNYRKARVYIPGDKNLIHNLEHVRSKRVDNIEEKQETEIVRILFFWHFDLTPRIRFAIFIIFFISIWLLAGIKLFIKKGFLRWGMFVCIIIAGIFLGSLSADIISESKNKPGVILTNEVIARKGDGETYQPSFQEPLHAGTEFNLLSERRGWYQIELVDGRECWVPVKDAGLVF